ncbi:MraY family glycosyltransferase [Thauera linaloolentis]|uniref:Glycosyl transferase family protein n=1 Tax=Thauera linaloolentis (strain DSM 12138 / JCM 21573 / CCUG 41526 / CIP 105981 / IAM 15112 / NBRC 102519 / 47Lol) TaxID=1123367 RepID=N6YU14_THAL4|nr:MraY family glycosyltransferase [Thauera linaloolentis]ENO85872.1 glycosyl transferase family protein [Thauera linaloolentis 47Lol = DSM 12138]MCM8567618.1 undecaprenyl/decaprenyl-phosphate alpha-N-acetylglucosaminyl 1-phosphate transferase [Thauera linaloolentis]
MMQGLIVLLLAALASAIVIRVMIDLAPRVGLIDHPGEHKQHEHVTPFVGGFGVLVALFVAVSALSTQYPGQRVAWASLLVCGGVMFLVGLADDRWKLGFRIRLVVQALLALLMVYGGGVALTDLGNMLFTGNVSLGMLAVPFTVFATIGGINALNMVDGIDGLVGTIAGGTLLLVALMTGLAGSGSTHLLAMALLGGAGGFLWFNMRHGRQHRARTFMGDNGSMTLGLLIVWLLASITQGESALVSPIAALWLFAIPLIDTLSVMGRRMWMGQSPFTPDRNHLHHLLQRAGFRVEDVVTTIGMLHFMLGGIGVMGLLWGIPEGVMFIAFLVVFASYLAITARPWRLVPTLRGIHRYLRLTPAANCGVFFGNCTLEHVEQINALVAPQLRENTAFRTRLYQQNEPDGKPGLRYAVVEIMLKDETAPLTHQVEYLRLIRKALHPHSGVYVRGYVHRDPFNDRRINPGEPAVEMRTRDRRQRKRVLLEESFTYVDRGRILDQDVHHQDAASEGPQRAPDTLIAEP